MGNCFKTQKKPPTTIQKKEPEREKEKLYKLASLPKVQVPENIFESTFPQINRDLRNNKILIATKKNEKDENSNPSSETEERTLPYNKKQKKSPIILE